ncbi:hypothetical protein FA95DRAFT_1123170 [Auriscalpium vulgare]|uniref:Uncharacterized protein n=1 Tax=Auriscalpium vulgare TaxID=40419 RepID=A0ACB8RVJ2_9AGAM|nr:hypothetical protein FA95DRAFT_1123170 [Auriscalpium vulgare]
MKRAQRRGHIDFARGVAGGISEQTVHRRQRHIWAHRRRISQRHEHFASVSCRMGDSRAGRALGRPSSLSQCRLFHTFSWRWRMVCLFQKTTATCELRRSTRSATQRILLFSVQLLTFGAFCPPLVRAPKLLAPAC